MLRLRQQPHEVDDVDDPYAQVRQPLAEDRGGGQRLQCGNLPGAGQHDVGHRAGIVAIPGPLPDAEPTGAVQRGVGHREPVLLGLLSGDDHVDVVPRPQTVVVRGQQGVGVRRQVDPDDLGVLVQHHVEKARVLVREAVVILAPHVGGEQVVEAGDRPPPGHLSAGLQPLGVLVEHCVDDVDERLVAGEHAVAAGEQVALQQPLTHVLAEHLDDPTVAVQLLVELADLRLPVATGHGEDVLQAIAGQLVGGEGQIRVGIGPRHLGQPPAQHAGGLVLGRAGPVDLHAVLAPVGQPQVTQQQAAVSVRVRTHASITSRVQGQQLRGGRAGLVEELLGPVRPQPGLEDPAMLAVGARSGQGDLMGAEGALDLLPVDDRGACPALRCAEDDHRPGRPRVIAARAGLPSGGRLDLRDAVEAAIEGRGEGLVDLSPGRRQPRRAARSRSRA